MDENAGWWRRTDASLNDWMMRHHGPWWMPIADPHEHRLEVAIEAAEEEVRLARVEALRIRLDASAGIGQREDGWSREAIRTAQPEPPGMELGW